MTTLIESPFDAILTAHLAIPEQVKAAVVPSPCNCDYDCIGDPLRYVKTSRGCPEHDDCESCGETLGVAFDAVPDVTTKRRSWLCQGCLDYCLDCDMSPCACEPFVPDVGPFCRHERGKVCEMCFDGRDMDAEAKAK
ncbi:MAG TPA: hypothetical protein VGM43_14555 [Bryobacteraceae bacterium]|jgi:hypothetical protein